MTKIWCNSLRTLLVAVFACWGSGISAQQNKPWAGFGMEGNVMAGKLLKHSTKFKGPIPELSTAVEINFFQQTYGKKDWEQRRHYPVVGFGFAYTNYGIDSIYGSCFSIYPNLQIPLITGKRVEWTMRAAFGLGYVTKHYELYPVWDTLNNAIGSHFNNYSFFSTDVRYRVNEHLDIQAGVNFSHISNAALRQPNLGINMYGGHIGVRYFPVTSQPALIHSPLPKVKNRWLAQLRVGLAANEYGEANGPLYPIYLVSAYASRRYRGKNKAFIGLDYSYHEGIYAFQVNNEINIGREKEHSWKSSVFVGNEFLFGRVGIMLQVGVYIKNAYLHLDPYYEKLGGNLYLIQNEKGLVKEMALSILLKTHRTQAELVEVGLGLGF